MPLPRDQPPAQRVVGSVEQDEEDRALGGGSQAIAVDALQRRAGNDDVAAGRRRLAKCSPNRIEPRPAILVGERDAGGHFFNIGAWMEFVGIAEDDAEVGSQTLSDGGLPAPANAHDDDRQDCRGLWRL